jgi:DNA invertase Pin-like site-specific DNA recombinase
LVRKTIQDMLTNKIRSAKGIEDQYFIENHHPAIITKEVFEQVQEKIKKNGKPISPPTRRYNPLLKRVHCGNCGCKFNRNKNRGKDYFKCISKMTNKSLCVSPVIKEDDIIKIMLGGFKERFDIENPKIIRLLQRLLIKINQNDHFEFHRLKALNQIQLAKSLRGVEYTDEDIEQMEESYKEFEKELVKIEDDRKFRLEAIKWLDTVENFEAFENQATIEYMRGWIKEITIYSLNDYKIHWIDGKNTEIGSCISIKPELEEPLVDENLIKLQIKGSFEENKITLEKGGDIQNKEGVMMQAAKRLKPEEPKSEKKSDLLFLNIKKQISNSVVMQTTVPIPSKKKLKVAAYIRVSTESDQQEISLKTQYTYFLYYILRDPQYILADIYIDDGKSGLTTKGRTEFNRLIDDCVAGKVNLIITKSLSRFARNTLDTLEYLNLLKNLDPPVNVWFQKENLYSLDEKSDLLIKLLSVIGQEESLNMGESIAWAKRSLAKRGIVNPGRLTYGYYYGENKEWLINKEEEKVVRRIYKEYQEGKEILKIAKGLESESIPSPSGQKNWESKKIKDILSSETYRGNYVFQKFYNPSGLIKIKTKNQGELPMYFIENHHQPIIDSDEWENIQTIMEIRDKERQTKIEKYLPDTKKNEAFSKKLYCEKCHSYLGYIRQVDRGKNNKENRHWRCYSARKGRGCDSIHLKQEYIEENFSQCLMDIKHNEAFREYINQYKESEKITPEEEKLRERLNLEREELNQKLYAEVEGELNKKGKDAKKVDKLIDRIMRLRQQINTFTQREEQLELIEEDVAAIMRSLKDYKDNTKTATGYYMKAPKFNKEIFEEHIEKGTVADDGKIIYKFKSGFEWAAPIDYSNFQIKARRKIAAKRAKERAEYLKGPEVKELLEYCIEPKTFKEMQNFLGKYAAYHSFRKHILEPLLKQGIVKMTIPDQPVHRLQKYYSVDRKKRN